MREYILLLPILFIFHDMEEIIGFKRFFEKNPWVFEKYPRITKAYRIFSTEGMALGVYEEFIPFFGISLLAYFFPNRILNTIWFALLLSLTVHFVIHIVLCIFIKKFIPSLVTSLICLPVSILIVINCVPLMQFDPGSLVLIVATASIMMLNLKFAHRLMERFNRGCYNKTHDYASDSAGL